MNKGVLKRKGDVADLEAALRGFCEAENAAAAETSPGGGTQPWQLPARSAGDRTGSGLQATEERELNWDLNPKSFRVQGLRSHEEMRRAMEASEQDIPVWVDPRWNKDFPEKTDPDVDSTPARIPEQKSCGYIHRSWHLLATPLTSRRILSLREGMRFLAPESCDTLSPGQRAAALPLALVRERESGRTALTLFLAKRFI
jgi:hypothetical protein